MLEHLRVQLCFCVPDAERCRNEVVDSWSYHIETQSAKYLPLLVFDRLNSQLLMCNLFIDSLQSDWSHLLEFDCNKHAADPDQVKSFDALTSLRVSEIAIHQLYCLKERLL